MKYQIFTPLLLLEFLNLFWYYLILRIAYRCVDVHTINETIVQEIVMTAQSRRTRRLMIVPTTKMKATMPKRIECFRYEACSPDSLGYNTAIMTNRTPRIRRTVDSNDWIHGYFCIQLTVILLLKDVLN